MWVYSFDTTSKLGKPLFLKISGNAESEAESINFFKFYFYEKSFDIVDPIESVSDTMRIPAPFFENHWHIESCNFQADCTMYEAWY